MCRVLIVEDDEALAGLWKSFLVSKGCEVTTELRLNSGIEAFKRLPHPDIVLLDLRFPDSPDDTYTIRSIALMKSIHSESKIILATGYPSLEIVKAAMEHGADEIQVKTNLSTSEKLWEVISSYLQKNTGKSGAEKTATLIEHLSQ